MTKVLELHDNQGEIHGVFGLTEKQGEAMFNAIKEDCIKYWKANPRKSGKDMAYAVFNGKKYKNAELAVFAGIMFETILSKILENADNE